MQATNEGSELCGHDSPHKKLADPAQPTPAGKEASPNPSSPKSPKLGNTWRPCPRDHHGAATLNDKLYAGLAWKSLR